MEDYLTYLKRQPERKEHPRRDGEGQAVSSVCIDAPRVLQRMPHFGYGSCMSSGYEVDVAVADDEN